MTGTGEILTFPRPESAPVRGRVKILKVYTRSSDLFLAVRLVLFKGMFTQHFRRKTSFKINLHFLEISTQFPAPFRHIL